MRVLQYRFLYLQISIGTVGVVINPFVIGTSNEYKGLGSILFLAPCLKPQSMAALRYYLSPTNKHEAAAWTALPYGTVESSSHRVECKVQSLSLAYGMDQLQPTVSRVKPIELDYQLQSGPYENNQTVSSLFLFTMPSVVHGNKLLNREPQSLHQLHVDCLIQPYSSSSVSHLQPSGHLQQEKIYFSCPNGLPPTRSNRVVVITKKQGMK